MSENITMETLDFGRLAPKTGSRIAIVGGCGGIGQALVAACLELDLKTAVLDLSSALLERPVPTGVLKVGIDASNEEVVTRGFCTRQTLRVNRGRVTP